MEDFKQVDSSGLPGMKSWEVKTQSKAIADASCEINTAVGVCSVCTTTTKSKYKHLPLQVDMGILVY